MTADKINLTELRADWKRRVGPREIDPEILLALINAVEAARELHSTSGFCPLCHIGGPEYFHADGCPLDRFTP